MASISHPNHYNNLPFNNSRFSSLHPLPIKPSSLPFHSLSLPRISDPPSCRCHGYSSSSDSPPPSNKRWDSAIQDVVRNAIKKFDEYMNSNKNRPQEDSSSGGVTGTEREEDEIWDWDRWKEHFVEVDEQERVVSILKSQLDHAVNEEDYQGAARLKVAIAAAATNDTVGRVLSHFNRAIKEESYEDAALIRDYAGAGLVGWWAGISEDVNDPYGRIIRITREHGRYVARGYSPRQLTTATTGVPLFEIFLTIDEKGEYKQQAVYLKRRRVSQDSQTTLSRPSVAAATAKLNTLDSTEDKSDLFAVSTEDSGDDEDRDDDSDVAEGLSSFQSILRDMIPGVKVKVLKVTAPEKVDRDMISKVIDNIMDEEDDEKDADLESLETEDEAKEGEQDQDEVEVDGGGVIDGLEQNEIGVKVVVGGLMQKLSGSVSSKDLLRVPARLEKKGRLSFTFSIEKDPNELDLGAKGKVSADRKANSRGQRSVDHVMFDLAKFIGRGRIPLKVLKDINDLINLTLSQAQNRQPLSGSTIFNRIEMPASLDPLNGLYIGAHGLYASEVIHLRRKFGQWQEDGLSEQSSSLEFYEYVEALKLTGDPFVPAGQIAFRAKVGKRNQLPHKGIIPEEFGVIARYKGQGRLAEPGFRNPRWVDGELVILDGKYIKGGPVVGFVYWAPEYHFLVFFNRLRLQE